MTKLEQAKKDLRTIAWICLGLAVGWPSLVAFLIGLAHIWEAWLA
jgi:hypothetical protein